MAKRLKLVLRPQDSVARFDGDEFVILAEDFKQLDELLLLCAKVMDCVDTHIELSQQAVKVNLSVGVAVYPDDAKDTKALLKASNVALYHAKSHVESCYQFYKQEMNLQVQRTLHLESQLSKAYQEHEFCNFYQPIVSAQTGKVAGLEVLLRWPSNDEYKPEDFANAAESSGLITKIMLQTLSRALIELRQWRITHPDLYVSINLSALDFESENLVEKIHRSISAIKVPASALVFEITESVMMHDSDKAQQSMEKLKALGCRIYMDDFGTGYASLTYLKRFPVDVLKIDKSFVNDIGVDKGDEAIINSTLTLAKSLGKECVAEGVENHTQLQFLRTLGCEYFQGYLFSKPVAGDEVKALLDTQWDEEFLG